MASKQAQKERSLTPQNNNGGVDATDTKQEQAWSGLRQRPLSDTFEAPAVVLACWLRPKHASGASLFGCSRSSRSWRNVNLMMGTFEMI
jgi:hypothetical protein